MKILFTAFLHVYLFAAQAQYTVSNEDGTVSFAGEHAGMRFDGQFNSWTATLKLPPKSGDGANENYFVNAEFDLSTAETGDAVYDETLPEGDWFDVKTHPIGTFLSTEIVANSNGYILVGTLELRGKALPIEFELKEEGKRLKASFAIDRIDYGIGLDSDPEAEWVSRDIRLSLDIPNQ